MNHYRDSNLSVILVGSKSSQTEAITWQTVMRPFREKNNFKCTRLVMWSATASFLSYSSTPPHCVYSTHSLHKHRRTGPWQAKIGKGLFCVWEWGTHTHSLLHCSSGLTQACFADIHLITVRDLFIYECWYCTFLCFYFLTSFKLLKELLC